MDGQFYVLEVIESKPGKMFSADTWEEAVDIAVATAKSADPASAGDSTDEEIREEIESDTNWSSHSGDIWVYILQTEPFPSQTEVFNDKEDEPAEDIVVNPNNPLETSKE